MKNLLLIIACFCYMQLFSQESEKKKEYLGVLTLTEKFKDEKNWTENEQAIVGEHFQRLVKMKEAGIVILAGRTELALNDPEMMGLVVFSARNDKEALQFMMDDPAVKNKIMIAKVHPYGLALIKCE